MEMRFTITTQRFVADKAYSAYIYIYICLSAHDEGSKDWWGLELAPGTEIGLYIILCNKSLGGSFFLNRTMGIGMEMAACYQRWHLSSWLLTSEYIITL